MVNSPVIPLYSQVKEYVIGMIERGELSTGDQLPSQRELCERFGISLMTARRAINDLVSEGIIQAIPGKGLFVAAPKQPVEVDPLVSFSEDMHLRGMRSSSQLLDSGLMGASQSLARILAVEAGAELARIHRLRLADGRPMAIQINYVVHRYCSGLLQYDFQTRGLFEVLRNEYGLRPVDTSTTVEAVLASEEEAALLQAPYPASLLLTEQVTFFENGRAIEFARTYYRGDRYHLTLKGRHV